MTPTDVFYGVLNGVLQRRYEDLPAFYAEQTVVRHPMSPMGDVPLMSREDVRRRFQRVAAMLSRDLTMSAQNIRVHETQDPEVVVAEFEYAAEAAGTDETFVAPCIFVLRVRDGQIVESRDYIDHVTMLKAGGRLDDLISASKPPDRRCVRQELADASEGGCARGACVRRSGCYSARLFGRNGGQHGFFGRNAADVSGNGPGRGTSYRGRGRSKWMPQ